MTPALVRPGLLLDREPVRRAWRDRLVYALGFASVTDQVSALVLTTRCERQFPGAYFTGVRRWWRSWHAHGRGSGRARSRWRIFSCALAQTA